jgi:uncharacterized protein with ParB-like and HNH nuclease domain
MQQPSKATATELFEGRKHYVIPAYQRPYVWNEEDQWAPLWDDIVRVSESHVRSSPKQFASHFLGAVVSRRCSCCLTQCRRSSPQMDTPRRQNDLRN